MFKIIFYKKYFGILRTYKIALQKCGVPRSNLKTTGWHLQFSSNLNQIQHPFPDLNQSWTFPLALNSLNSYVRSMPHHHLSTYVFHLFSCIFIGMFCFPKKRTNSPSLWIILFLSFLTHTTFGIHSFVTEIFLSDHSGLVTSL